MDDLVKRLRGATSWSQSGLAIEAADEIERLRKELEQVTRERDEYANQLTKQLGVGKFALQLEEQLAAAPEVKK